MAKCARSVEIPLDSQLQATCLLLATNAPSPCAELVMSMSAKMAINLALNARLATKGSKVRLSVTAAL